MATAFVKDGQIVGASILSPLFRLGLAARAAYDNEGETFALSQAAQKRVLGRVSAIFAEEFAKQQGVFESVDLQKLKAGFFGMFADVVGSAFEGFIDDSLLNDAERLFRQDGRSFVLALFAMPVDVVFGLLSRKIDRILDLIDQGSDVLFRVADKITAIGLAVASFDRVALLARNSLLFSSAVPLAKDLRDDVDKLLKAVTAFEGRDFTFNIPGLALPVICAALEAIADILVGDDAPSIDLLAKISELQVELDRVLSIIDQIIEELLGVPDFQKNLEDSRRNLASLRAAELDKLRRLLDYFIELGTGLATQSPLVVAQQAVTMGTEFKRMVSVLCRDTTSIADALKDTIQANALNVLNLALAQLDTTPLTELSAKLRSFIAVARAAVTQDLGARFQTELLAATVAINAVTLIFDALRAIFGGFPQIRPAIIDLLIEGLANNGFSESVAALTSDGSFDSRAAAASHLQSSAGELIEFINDEINKTTDSNELAQLREVREILVAFERSGSSVAKAANARIDLKLNAGAAINRKLRTIEEGVLRVLVRNGIKLP
jgi:hypothetical protein